MPVHIVGGSQMIRDMFSNICERQQYDVATQCRTFAELGDIDGNDLVLVYSTSTTLADHADIVAMRDRLPSLRILVVTGRNVPGHVQRALSEQAEAMIPETKSADALAAALTVIQAGYRIVRPGRQSTERPKHRSTSRVDVPLSDHDIGQLIDDSDNVSELSDRENAILAKLIDGRTNKDIANELGICEATVKVHLRACYRKIGAKNRTQAAMWASQRL